MFLNQHIIQENKFFNRHPYMILTWFGILFLPLVSYCCTALNLIEVIQTCVRWIDTLSIQQIINPNDQI